MILPISSYVVILLKNLQKWNRNSIAIADITTPLLPRQRPKKLFHGCLTTKKKIPKKIPTTFALPTPAIMMQTSLASTK